MPFGLTNAPATFQHMMNEIFADVMDQFLVVYLDDILIFSFDSTQHTSHVHEVLCRLHQHGLYAKLEKCEFDVTSIDFVGYVISPTGLGMDPKKVASFKTGLFPRLLRMFNHSLVSVIFIACLSNCSVTILLPSPTLLVRGSHLNRLIRLGG